MDVELLAILTSIMKNKAAFNPKIAAILDKSLCQVPRQARGDNMGDKPVPTTPAPAEAPSAAGPSNV